MTGAVAPPLRGGCHCGRVRFEADIDASGRLRVLDCNCTICRMAGFLHLIGAES